MTVYGVFTREHTIDQAEMDIYGPAAAAAGVGHPVTPLAFYGPIETLEGSKVEGAVIISFPTLEDAHAWYYSPAYQAAKEHRLKGADYRVFFVEGV
ncbi:DUF1330 domain-containing protein [Acidisoma cladoniae]|jgi:uncharacterized protein (DUF1330 family)|uniref:DUF1330 domain-containing protein n=1 Tax=Acidisoma cladoniae TaxID=3040935 RepID=UPI00254F92B3|nr:DUF1330 domain-containing protein [Acidisoma sp. PAMC 29798]